MSVPGPRILTPPDGAHTIDTPSEPLTLDRIKEVVDKYRPILQEIPLREPPPREGYVIDEASASLIDQASTLGLVRAPGAPRHVPSLEEMLRTAIEAGAVRGAAWPSSPSAYVPREPPPTDEHVQRFEERVRAGEITYLWNPETGELTYNIPPREACS